MKEDLKDLDGNDLFKARYAETQGVNLEAAQYEIEITYPGADGDKTSTFEMFCRSDGETGVCEDNSGS